MGGISLAVIGAIVLFLAFGTRKGLIYLMLPAVFAYPHRITMGLMPLNAGFDDMFVMATFVIMVIKGYRVQGPWMTRMILWLFAIIVVAEITSLGLTHAGLVMVNIKTVLKAAVILSFGLTMLMTLETEEDVRRMLISLAVAVAVASAIAVADWWGFDFAKWFYVEIDLEHEMLHSRATGSFLSTDGVGITLAMVGWLGASHLIFRSSIPAKIVAMLWCVLLVFTLVASASRSGMIGVGFGLIAVLLFARGRRITVVGCLAAAVLIVALVSPMRAAFVAMMERTQMQSAEEGGLWAGTGRSTTLISTIDYSLGPWTGFCGAGETFYSTRGWYAHNGYFDVMLCFGLAGLTWGVIYLNRIIRQAFFLMRHGTSFLARNFGIAVLLGLVGTAGVSFGTGPPMNTFWRYEIVMFGAVLSVLMRLHIGQEKPISMEPYEDGYEDAPGYEGLPGPEGEGGLAQS